MTTRSVKQYFVGKALLRRRRHPDAGQLSQAIRLARRHPFVGKALPELRRRPETRQLSHAIQVARRQPRQEDPRIGAGGGRVEWLAIGAERLDGGGGGVVPYPQKDTGTAQLMSENNTQVQ